MNERPNITVGDLVLPYTKDLPIATFHQDNDQNQDLFIRAKRHEQGVWYSDCDATPTGEAKHPLTAGRGVVIFVPRVVKKGELVRLVRVYPGGASGRGAIIPAPASIVTPMDYELSKSQVQLKR